MCDLRRLLERLTRFDLKLAPNNALLSAAEMIFLGHTISSEGAGPDPGNVKAPKEMPMPQNVSQLRSLLGFLLYYMRQFSKMAARTRQLYSLLRKGVKFELSPYHERIVREMMLDELSSPNVLAFPEFRSCYFGIKKIPARYGCKRKRTRCGDRTSTTRRLHSAPPLTRQNHSRQ